MFQYHKQNKRRIGKAFVNKDNICSIFSCYWNVVGWSETTGNGRSDNNCDAERKSSKNQMSVY